MENKDAKIMINSQIELLKAEKRNFVKEQLNTILKSEAVLNMLTLSVDFLPYVVKEVNVTVPQLHLGASVIALLLSAFPISLELEDYRKLNMKMQLLKKYERELNANINQFEDIEPKEFDKHVRERTSEYISDLII